MKQKKIYITESDKSKLQKLFKTTLGFRHKDLITVRSLLQELDRAEIITNEKIRRSTIIMNSQVLIKDIDTGEELKYTLVYPEYSNIGENKISILAPIGTALLGYREGDTIEWKVPAGTRRLLVKKILYQPKIVSIIKPRKVYQQ